MQLIPAHDGAAAGSPTLELAVTTEGGQVANIIGDTIWVTSFDGANKMSVSKEVLSLVPFINKELLATGRGTSDNYPVCLPRQVTGDSLTHITRYIEFHSAPGRSDKERKQFDEKFVKMETKKLCELTSAADSLEMRPLVDMASRALARLIEGKSPEEIREAFNLPDDLTEEEKLEPVKNLIDDPRIRLLNRLYAKKRKELQTKKLEDRKAAEERAKLQDTRTLDELLSFIEESPDGGGNPSSSGSRKQPEPATSKASKKTKQKEKAKQKEKEAKAAAKAKASEDGEDEEESEEAAAQSLNQPASCSQLQDDKLLLRGLDLDSVIGADDQLSSSSMSQMSDVQSAPAPQSQPRMGLHGPGSQQQSTAKGQTGPNNASAKGSQTQKGKQQQQQPNKRASNSRPQAGPQTSPKQQAAVGMQHKQAGGAYEQRPPPPPPPPRSPGSSPGVGSSSSTEFRALLSPTGSAGHARHMKQQQPRHSAPVQQHTKQHHIVPGMDYVDTGSGGSTGQQGPGAPSSPATGPLDQRVQVLLFNPTVTRPKGGRLPALPPLEGEGDDELEELVPPVDTQALMDVASLISR